MITQAASAGRPLSTGLAIIMVGVLVALVTVLSLTAVRPVLLAFAAGGLVLLIPSLMMRDQRAYWLFLLALSMPFDISKRITTWLVQPWDLYHQYGMPASGTLSLDIYLTDVVLIVMLLPWLVRLCLRQDSLYFPKIGYIFILYLAWALIVSLIEAKSFYLSIFEWCREVLYLLSFLYLINNVVTRSQFRAIVLALFVGLVIASGSVIGFFASGTGTDTQVLSGLYREQGVTTKPSQGQDTLYVEGLGLAGSTKRSSGMFTHPAHAAYYLEYVLPIVLAFLVTAHRALDRFLLGAMFCSGVLGVYLTFSRSGLIGVFVGVLVVFAAGRWSRLISQRAFRWSVLIFATAMTVSAPLLIYSLWSRSQPITKRLELNEAGLATYWQRPLAGAGLNNSSAVADERSLVKTARGERMVAVVHNHYLLVLIEVGLVGFLLFFAFFGQIVVAAFRHMRAAETEMKLLLVGIVAALASIAIHNLGDPFGGHPVQAMLWLHAGLLIAICRRVQAGDLFEALRSSAPIAAR